LSVALVDCEMGKTPAAGLGMKLLAEFNLSGEKARAENIAYFIEKMFSSAGFDIKKVEAVAVVQGPGSYGGVRGGVTSAKVFAQVLGVPVFGVSTLEAMAYNFVGAGKTIMVILDAKAGEFNVALFALPVIVQESSKTVLDGGETSILKRLTEDFVIGEAKLIEKIRAVEGEMLVAGALDKIDFPPSVLKKENLSFVAFAQSFPRASLTAALAIASYRAGRAGKKIKRVAAENCLKLLPRYSHQPNIRGYKK
jgi:tRNA threonylcarbamoyl adenosine modification protein YeaZ